MWLSEKISKVLKSKADFNKKDGNWNLWFITHLEHDTIKVWNLVGSLNFSKKKKKKKKKEKKKKKKKKKNKQKQANKVISAFDKKR